MLVRLRSEYASCVYITDASAAMGESSLQRTRPSLASYGRYFTRRLPQTVSRTSWKSSFTIKRGTGGEPVCAVSPKQAVIASLTDGKPLTYRRWCVMELGEGGVRVTQCLRGSDLGVLLENSSLGLAIVESSTVRGKSLVCWARKKPLSDDTCRGSCGRLSAARRPRRGSLRNLGRTHMCPNILDVEESPSPGFLTTVPFPGSGSRRGADCPRFDASSHMVV